MDFINKRQKIILKEKVEEKVEEMVEEMVVEKQNIGKNFVKDSNNYGNKIKIVLVKIKIGKIFAIIKKRCGKKRKFFVKNGKKKNKKQA